MVTVRNRDHGTLQYDWFINEDETECTVLEKYVNSDVVLSHMANLGELLGQLLAASDFSGEVYANPSDKLVAAFEGLDIKIYGPFQQLLT